MRKVTPRKPRAVPILAGSVSSLLVSFGIVGFLHELTNLPFRTTVGEGLGLFWFLALYRTWPPKRNVESNDQHKAALVRQFGHAKESLEIEWKFTQKFGPRDVLVSVHATSVNPIDVKFRQGYGSSLLHCVARSSGLPYVAVTVFSALVDCVGLSRNNA